MDQDRLKRIRQICFDDKPKSKSAIKSRSRDRSGARYNAATDIENIVERTKLSPGNSIERMKDRSKSRNKIIEEKLHLN